MTPPAASSTLKPQLRAQSRSFDLKWVVLGACVAAIVYLALIPLGFLLWQSFFTPHTAAKPAEFTLQNYVQAYSSLETARLLVNSLLYSIGTALLSLFVGTALAWMNERTNTPFKRLFFGLALVPLIIPGILFTVSWIMLGSPKIGILNLWLQRWFDTDYVFFNVYSLWGMIWVDGLHYSPMAFLLMTAAFRSMDPALEESAAMSGANLAQTVWRITLALSWPAVFATLLILFVRALESFEVPALLGMPAGIFVLTSAIYEAIHRYPSQVGLASAYGVTLLALTSAGVYFQSRLSGAGTRYATMTGKGFRPRRIDLGGWRYFTAALFVAYFLLIVGLPLFVLVWSSLQKFYTAPSIAGLANLTLDPYRFVFSHPTMARAFWNSLLLCLGAATVVMLVTSVIAWIVIKTRIPGRWVLDNIASLPMVFPGLVLGLATMIFYLNVNIGVYGTMWIMLLAYITRFMPYGLRYASASMVQIHRELEESAAMSGASWGKTFVRIILPLLKPGLLAGWIYVAIVSVRELSTSILLYSPGTEVVSIVIWELWENGQYVELSAVGVLLILFLFALVQFAQWLGSKYGIKES
ncbi:MAG TPA: iron ABC transporter permease [Burkholderiales bacterium]|nr:iron ABC transporter permease [Burkholderiales bacterium]